jgi:hypothetical protein
VNGPRVASDEEGGSRDDVGETGKVERRDPRRGGHEARETIRPFLVAGPPGNHGRDPSLRREPPRELCEPLLSPDLFGAAGARVQQSEGARKRLSERVRFGARTGEEVPGVGGAHDDGDPERSGIQQLEILVHDVSRLVAQPDGVVHEDRRGLLPAVAGAETHDRSSGEPREQRRLPEALCVHGGVGREGAELGLEPADLPSALGGQGPTSPAPRVREEEARDGRVPLEEPGVGAFRHPTHLDAREARVLGEGQSVEDVAHRGESDDEEAAGDGRRETGDGRRSAQRRVSTERIRSMRSVVA